MILPIPVLNDEGTEWIMEWKSKLNRKVYWNKDLEKGRINEEVRNCKYSPFYSNNIIVLYYIINYIILYPKWIPNW
jgi:hypothetical protein